MIISLESMPGSNHRLISGPCAILEPGAVWSRAQVQCGAGPECFSGPGAIWSWNRVLFGPGPRCSVVFSLKPNCKMSQSQTFGLGLNMV